MLALNSRSKSLADKNLFEIRSNEKGKHRRKINICMNFKEIVSTSVDKFLVLPERNSQQKAGAKTQQWEVKLMPSPALLSNTAQGSVLDASSDIIWCSRSRMWITVVWLPSNKAIEVEWMGMAALILLELLSSTGQP